MQSVLYSWGGIIDDVRPMGVVCAGARGWLRLLHWAGVVKTGARGFDRDF